MMDNQIVRYNVHSNTLVVKHNALIEASHRLGEVEQRLILLAILQARKHCNKIEELKGQELIIHADDYARIFDITHQMAYKALKKAVMGLFEAKWGYKYTNDKGNKAVRYERFTQSAQYVENEGLVTFKFADAIIPMLVEMEKNFTSYEIEQVAKMSSQYAMRLYEFLLKHLDRTTNKGWFDISLGDLRFRLGLYPDEYKRMGDFKKGVLDLAIKQINETADLTVSYTQKKQGRVIVGFHFEFKKKAKKAEKTKTKQKENEDRDPNTKDMFDGLTDQEREIVAQKNAYADQKGITDPVHRHNLINQGLERHRQAEQAEQVQKEREKAERQAKKLAKQKQEEQKKLEQEKELQRQANLIATFESLTIDEQERVLDEVGKMVGGLFVGFFETARGAGTAHKDPQFMAYFYNILGV